MTIKDEKYIYRITYTNDRGLNPKFFCVISDVADTREAARLAEAYLIKIASEDGNIINIEYIGFGVEEVKGNE